MAKPRTTRTILLLSISFHHKYSWKKAYPHQGLRATNDLDGEFSSPRLHVSNLLGNGLHLYDKRCFSQAKIL